MKFGKHIQKRQLDIPEYAAHFVDYKALKKLIKALSATPVLPTQNDSLADPLDSRAALKANKATFFFRLERELDKVNTFYLLKEAELKLRLTSLVDQKRLMQAQQSPTSKQSSRYIALEEGFRQFSSDLTKLQQFVEINATAFSKILKKWDKTSKSDEKVVYLSRAVEVQPCFNRDVISDLSDQATTNLLDFAAWAEGERIPYVTAQGDQDTSARAAAQDDADLDNQILQAITVGNAEVVQDWATRIQPLPDARQRITKVFLSTAADASEDILRLLLETGCVALNDSDDINHRNLLHKAASSKRTILLEIGLSQGVNVRAADVYGRIPLHYACMHGLDDMIQALLSAGPDTVDFKDHDNFTPLIHAIVHSHINCVNILLDYKARIDPLSESEHIPLNLACQHGSLPIVETLLRRHPQILPDAEGLYPQHLVARSAGTPELLLLLRNYGANLDQPDKLYMWTPLFHSASEGNVACLQALLQCKVDTNYLDEKGLPALHYATWEGHIDCIKLLEPFRDHKVVTTIPEISVPAGSRSTTIGPSATPGPMSRDIGDIPLFSLPPPIIPVRRYGHNFLEHKTFIIIKFGDQHGRAIQFYEDNKYPAARITVSSKSSDLIPRNILLPLQDDSRYISFQIDNLDGFSIDFDIYPTFGAKVIARAVVSSPVFTDVARSTDAAHLELLDPRLRAIGRLNFTFLVVKPFQGIPLEITHFSTYWKATKQTDSHPGALIAGSSLSGEYVRLYVQVTRDGIPVVYPRLEIPIDGDSILIPVNFLTFDTFRALGTRRIGGQEQYNTNLASLCAVNDSQTIYNTCASAFGSLQDILANLQPHVNIELHILYPESTEYTGHPRTPQSTRAAVSNINAFTDAVLKAVFDHARRMRETADGFQRSIVFSSFNPDVCVALNWKQPNYPVLLCDALGLEDTEWSLGTSVLGPDGGALSVKEAVQLARSNNLMGLICSRKLLDIAPHLIESIKTAGLVLVSDLSNAPGSAVQQTARGSSFSDTPGEIDGTLRGNAVLRFNDSVDL